MDIRDHIRSIPGYPKPGIIFRDISTLLADPRAFRATVDGLVQPHAGARIDRVAAIEARGFILGGAVAHQLSCGFSPVRKQGKLPWRTRAQKYELEYGVDTLEVHDDAFRAGEQVLLVDDLIATGGTAVAAVDLIESFAATVIGCSFVVDIPALGGCAKLRARGLKVRTLCEFDGA